MQRTVINTDQLTFTRFLAAISIVIYHFGTWVYPFDTSFLNILFGKASLGVSYFFLLSGFVMVLAYWNRGETIAFKNYINNRIARIFPLYFFALLVILLYYFIRIQVLSTPSTYIPTIIDFFLNLTFLQAWFPSKALTMNTPGWSLSAEMFFYLIFPLFFNNVLKVFKPKVVFISVAIFFLISQLVLHYLVMNQLPILGPYYFYLPLLHINAFFVGNALGLFFLLYTTELKNRILSILTICILCIIVFYFPLNGLIYHNGLMVVLFAPLLYFIATDDGVIARVLKKKPMIYLGEISYGIYLLQFPVYFFFTATLTFFHHKINQPLFYIFLILLIFISALCYKFIEMPLRKVIKNYGSA